MVPAGPTGLGRFLHAQAPLYRQVVEELTRGRKDSHWMWFIFPQLRGLGHSTMAHTYGLDSAQEAASFIRHPVLGPRLLKCTWLVLGTRNRSAHEIFGAPDDVKFRSCLTLFATVTPGYPVFQQALVRFYGGESDRRTRDLLAADS